MVRELVTLLFGSWSFRWNNNGMQIDATREALVSYLIYSKVMLSQRLLLSHEYIVFEILSN